MGERRPATLKDLERNCEDTASSLLYLHLESLGLRTLEADHVASHIGVAYGIAVLLRASAYHASKRVSYLPTQLALHVCPALTAGRPC